MQCRVRIQAWITLASNTFLTEKQMHLSANAVAVGASGSTGRIISSSDGGQTWSTSFSTSLVLTDIAVAYQGGVTHYLVGGINTAASTENHHLGYQFRSKTILIVILKKHGHITFLV